MNTPCDAQRSILVAIDLQERLMPAIHDGSAVVKQAQSLAQVARLLQVPVVGTVQNPEGLGATVPEIAALCDTLIVKTDFDACAESLFLSALDTPRDEILLAGCEAHVCVLQTAATLLRRHRRVRIVADATGSRRSFDKDMALQRLRALGADIVTAEMVMFEWMRSSTHPRFRDILKLIR